MSGFLGINLGKLIPRDVLHGIAAGFQYFADYLKLELRAVEQNDADLRGRLDEVRAAWLAEVSDEFGKVRTDAISLALSGSGDPFATSRHLMQAVQKDYEGK